MSDSAVFLQPAFILQHRNYRESSLIIDVLTRDYGVISILARGVRKNKSKLAGLLLPFSCLKLSFVGKADLKIFTGAELIERVDLTGLGLYCGFYVNELICHFLHKYDPHPEVYSEYLNCIRQLKNSNKIEQSLRVFELNLMDHIGYGVTLGNDATDGSPIVKDTHYHYVDGTGLVRNTEGLVSGETLLALQNGSPLDKQGLAEAKQLMRTVLDYHLQGKALKSRAVLAKIIKYLQ